MQTAYPQKLKWYMSMCQDMNNTYSVRPDCIPNSIDEAYEIQKSLSESLSKDIAGWKIGGSNRTSHKVFDSDEILIGPIFSDKIFSGSEKISFTSNDYINAEIEVAFRLSGKITDINNASNINIVDLIESFGPAIEFPVSRFTNLDKDIVPLMIADMCASGALYYTDWQSIDDYVDSRHMDVRLSSDEGGIVKTKRDLLLDSPLNILTKFIELSIKYGLSLKPGQVVATGGISDCVQIRTNKVYHLSGPDNNRQTIYT